MSEGLDKSGVSNTSKYWKQDDHSTKNVRLKK